MISLTICSVVFSVVSISQTLPLWFWSASIRHVSRISALRFSQSFWFSNPLFCICCFRCFGFLRRTKTCVVWFCGVTAGA